MKRLSSVIFSLAFAAVLPLAAGATTTSVDPSTELMPGTLVKAPGSSSVYYIDQDLTRHAFPNLHVFKSWYSDFKNVVSVSNDVISQYPLGGNVPYKPSVRLVKIQTDPKVYAVDDGGVLRWIKSEAVARQLYGDNWNQMVDDLADTFFADYTVGMDVDSAAAFNTKLKDFVKAIFETLRSERLNKHSHKGAGADDLSHEGYGKNKAAICHKFGKEGEHTIYVAKPAVAAHLRHGDKEGACASDETSADKTAPVVSGAAVSAITSSGAKAAFTTDENAIASVYYSTSTPVSKTTASVVTASASEKTHELVLTGLAAATKYYALIQAVDAAGNVATAQELSFTTLTAADTTAPVVSALTIDTITLNSAKVHITVNEAATAKVYFSTAAPVVVATAAHVDAAAAAATQVIDLTGLANGTTYHVVAVVTDAAGNATTSSELSFTTLTPDTTAPVVSALTIDTITLNSAKVHVATNESATAKVYYSTSTPVVVTTAAHVDATTAAASQVLDLTGLASGTTYHVVAVVTDAAGNATTSSELSFATLTPDTTAPVISSVTVDGITASAANVHVAAGESATIVVYYGTASPVDLTIALHLGNATAGASYDAALTSLAAGTTYHVVVTAADAAGNTATSTEQSFTTLAAAAE